MGAKRVCLFSQCTLHECMRAWAPTVSPGWGARGLNTFCFVATQHVIAASEAWWCQPAAASAEGSKRLVHQQQQFTWNPAGMQLRLAGMQCGCLMPASHLWSLCFGRNAAATGKAQHCIAFATAVLATCWLIQCCCFLLLLPTAAARRNGHSGEPGPVLT